MARSRNSLPSYLPHKQSGKARAVWTDTLGIRHFKMLPGSFDSPESKTAFARLQLELAAAPVASSVDPVSISVCEIILLTWSMPQSITSRRMALPRRKSDA